MMMLRVQIQQGAIFVLRLRFTPKAGQSGGALIFRSLGGCEKRQSRLVQPEGVIAAGQARSGSRQRGVETERGFERASGTGEIEAVEVDVGQLQAQLRVGRAGRSRLLEQGSRHGRRSDLGAIRRMPANVKAP